MMHLPATRRLCWLAVIATGVACQPDTLSIVPPTGDVEGYLCDPNTDQLAANATISGTGIRDTVSTTADDRGFFTLKDLAVGSQTLIVQGAGGTFTDTITIDIVAETKFRLTDPPCLPPPTGSVDGRICAVESQIGSGEGYYLADATVEIIVGTESFTTTTDIGGNFTLTDVPAGTRSLEVTKGSFSATVDVVIHPDQTTTLDYVCVESGVRLAVVTGLFDSVQKVLKGLGFTVRECQEPGLDVACPASVDATANITIFKGEDRFDQSYLLTLFNDSFYLGQFDIVFLNCGLIEDFILTDQLARDNLRDFVNNGGSLYVSDYAYDVIRDIFQPSGTPVLNFYGDGSVGAAKGGVLNATVSASVVNHPTLATLVGGTVDLAYDQVDWGVLAVNQPSNVEIFITGDIQVDPDGSSDPTLSPVPLNGAPLLVSVPYGAGRIVYTTFHVTSQPTADVMRDILRYIVFEL